MELFSGVRVAHATGGLEVPISYVLTAITSAAAGPNSGRLITRYCANILFLLAFLTEPGHVVAKLPAEVPAGPSDHSAGR